MDRRLPVGSPGQREIQGVTGFGSALQVYRSGGACLGAEPAAEAAPGVQACATFLQIDRAARAARAAGPAAPARGVLDARSISRGGEHGDPPSPGLEGAAATGAAVADRIKAAEHGLLEKGMVHISALPAGGEHGEGFLRRNPTAAPRVMIGDERGERLADDDADIERQAGVRPCAAAGAVEENQVVGVFEDQIARPRVGEDRFQPGQVKRFLQRHQTSGGRRQDDLAVVAVGEGAPEDARSPGALKVSPLWPPTAEGVCPRGEGDVGVGKADIGPGVEPLAEVPAEAAAEGLEKRDGGGQRLHRPTNVPGGQPVAVAKRMAHGWTVAYADCGRFAIEEIRSCFPGRLPLWYSNPAKSGDAHGERLP